MSIAIIMVAVTVMKLEADRQMVGIVHRELQQVSEQGSDRVVKWLYERSADLKMIAGIMTAAKLENIKGYSIRKTAELYPISTGWVGTLDPNCRVMHTSGGLKEGDLYEQSICDGAKAGFYVGRARTLSWVEGGVVEDPQSTLLLPIAYPIRNADGTLVGFVAMEIRTVYLDSLLTSVPLAVTDGQPARVFIISRNTNRVVIGGDCADTPVSSKFMENVGHLTPGDDLDWPDRGGWISASTTTGTFRDVPNLNWVVVARADRTESLNLVDDLSTRMIKWGAVLSLGSILLALVLAKSLGKPLAILSQVAIDGTSREIAVREATNVRYREISDLATALDARFAELAEANRATTAALVDREALLKEVHHRVKNNLQVIISLMRLQGSRICDNPDGRSVVERLTSRVQVIGWLYSKLYERAIFEKITASSFLQPLVSVIQDTYPNAGGLRVRTSFADVPLNFDQTLILGMLAIEVVTNAMQHAYPRGSLTNTIEITLTEIGVNRYEFVVSDQGVGFDPSRRYGGIGLTMAGRMATQLGDPIDITSSEAGSVVRITFTITPENEAALSVVA